MTDQITVNDFTYCDATRNVDNMLTQFQADRELVVDMVYNDIDRLITELWTPMSPICYDPKCLFNMGVLYRTVTIEDRIEGRSIINEAVSNYHACAQCTNMRRLIDFSKTGMGKPFMIECGSNAGSQLVLTETNLAKLYLLKESPPPSVARAMQNPYITNFTNCSQSGCGIVNYNDIDYIGLDPYTNNLLINWTLTNYLDQLGINNVLKMYIGFVCQSQGYDLYEYPDIGRFRHLQEYSEYLEYKPQPSPTAKADDKTPIAKCVVKGVIMQLFATLHALRVFDFSHGGPSSRSILLKRDVCSYVYDGVHVEGPLTIKLTDFHHAGITVSGNRLYNKSVIADEELLKKPFRPVIEKTTIKPFSFDQESRETIDIYRLKDPNTHIQETMLFMYIKHLGLPIYQSSFDAYAFMICLMADRSFYVTVMEDESMYLLWRSMWLPQEFEAVQDRIQQLHQSHDPVTRVDKVLRFLAGFGLRCNMIDYGWNLIKTW